MFWRGLEAGSPEYEVARGVRVFRGEVLLPQLLELVPGHAGLALD